MWLQKNQFKISSLFFNLHILFACSAGFSRGLSNIILKSILREARIQIGWHGGLPLSFATACTPDATTGTIVFFYSSLRKLLNMRKVFSQIKLFIFCSIIINILLLCFCFAFKWEYVLSDTQNWHLWHHLVL